ncbi:type II toxin-antitoxin system HicA family toxin [Anaerocellum diazotrophicum]|uniref:Addiction module toxin, HicA family protein n=1 Tax=Caldicellulosiruptor diazotrophicus TaxID=2806205 RepID=A0ABM7NKI3_9FIRM|nr:type II toxin-antitoxin system HicA family toxin [Caldicellulosiruptor diazotrophicus]BCS80613.1 addiction module toxin, HicA family protein [Caldicellulosiruptor diazotrophicus]
MKAYSSREIIKILIADGWYLEAVKGDHYQFKHPSKKGKVTVPHPKKNLPIRTVKRILKQAGIKIEDIGE